VSAASLHPFNGMSVWQLMMARVSGGGDRPFLTWQPFDARSRTWTYRELARDAAAVAAGLAGRRIQAGDRVLIHLENSPEFLISWFACAALGAVAVTTNTRSTPDELGYYAEHSGAVAAITQPKYVELLAKAAPSLRFVACTDHDGGVPADPGDVPFPTLLANPNDLLAPPHDPLAPMSVQYTSGTTSRPKGVLWTHANALWAARVNAAHETLRPEDCHLTYLPLFHTNALAYSMLATLWTGARLVLIPKWSTSRFWDISLRHGCTWLSLMGLSQRFILGSEPPPGHRYRLFGGPVCDLESDARYGVKTLGWWGMTETLSTVVVGDPFQPNRPLSMGRPAPEYGVRVVRADGTPVEPEETGELQVRGIRGLSLFAEYLNNPQATAASFTEDGWFRTGDLVSCHGDGHLSFANRDKDMLKVGAENVSAAEVERVILEVPGVVEAAVVGRPDEKLDEVPVAFITTGPDADVADRVSSACERLLADFKIPRSVYVVRELPRSTLSKIDKNALRAVAGEGDNRAAAQNRWAASAATDPSGDAR
jgi:crotonobetaine/carnitine-CoA ligase